MRRTYAVAVLAMIVASGSAQADDDFFEDLFAPYNQRIEGVTASGGDAKAVNAATHIDNPWPHYAADRRIPGNGERMVGAIERYRSVEKLDETPTALVPIAISPSGLSGGTASGE